MLHQSQSLLGREQKLPIQAAVAGNIRQGGQSSLLVKKLRKQHDIYGKQDLKTF